MLHRKRLVTVPEDVSVIDLIPRLRRYDVVVVDVDDTLVPDGAPGSLVAARLEEVRTAWQACAGGRLVVVSNGSRRRAGRHDGVVWQVNKPWTRARRLSISPNETVAVVGDRLMVDGLLARRWGADFYMMSAPGSCHRPHSVPALGLGRRVRRWLFDQEPFERSQDLDAHQRW
jgi:predicted HAD superfamily phosphohydrolase YqeG